MIQTHKCGELRSAHIGKRVVLAGWVNRRRDHGGLVFIDLRDREGLVQVVFNPEISPEAHTIADSLRNEYVLQVWGEVARRPSGTENLKLPTGEIEIIAGNAVVLNSSKNPPFYINEETEVDENLRLKYRYLDLRRPRMKENVILRHQVIKFMRDFLTEREFIEIETPILIKSTPEGARDYLVPSRVHAGKFYALPQSPQQLKQLLMVAGFEKYFQIARCFRDEDPRADRQPEFTQLDMEMSFVDEEDILGLLEEMFTNLISAVKPSLKLIRPFPRLSFREAMDRFGCDKPDIRFALEFKDLSDIAVRTDFAVFREAVQKGGRVKGICAPGCAKYSRRQIDDLTQLCKEYGAKGLATIALTDDSGRLGVDKAISFVAKFLTSEDLEEIAQRFEAGPGDMILILADQQDTVNRALGQLRLEMGRRLGLIDPELLAFAFILDFPLFQWVEEEQRWDSMHHPFTAPFEEDIPLLDVDPGKVRSRHYDVICNGAELSSGSIRIHQRELQEKVLATLGYKNEEMHAQFGQLLEALDYGAPPHGGIAPGIDRLLMLMAGEQNIREVIPFPKTQSAYDPLFDAPSEVSEQQLKELRLAVLKESSKVEM